MHDWWFSIYSWRRGQLVGCDTFGNRYYQKRKLSNALKLRRWVVYKGGEDASKVPAEWHGWLHYRTDELPALTQPHAWAKPHLPNLTGTVLAHRSKLESPQLVKDYEPWKP